MTLVMFALGYLSALSVRIHREALVDDPHPADVIMVMGAAEYQRRPSPVLKLGSTTRWNSTAAIWRRM